MRGLHNANAIHRHLLYDPTRNKNGLSDCQVLLPLRGRCPQPGDPGTSPAMSRAETRAHARNLQRPLLQSSFYTGTILCNPQICVRIPCGGRRPLSPPPGVARWRCSSGTAIRCPISPAARASPSHRARARSPAPSSGTAPTALASWVSVARPGVSRIAAPALPRPRAGRASPSRSSQGASDAALLGPPPLAARDLGGRGCRRAPCPSVSAASIRPRAPGR